MTSAALTFRAGIPVPERSPETHPYWDGAARGELWLRRCGSCGRPHHYPRSTCPFCFAPDPAWERASGHGVVYSYSVAGPADAPYVIAYVTLAEGPTMLTNLIGCDPQAVAIGQPVVLAAGPAAGGPPVPMFRPA
ncbi:MAG: OB-fold domain-containing protein [Burkholderiaceae bacterium]|nr:OB-fold domain-containing protein [Burkholderiaceae bacterium]